MQTFTATNEGLKEGISLQKTDKLGWSLILGEHGRGRWQEHVKLDSRRPPSFEEINNTAIVKYAGIVAFEAVGRQRHAFTIPNNEDNRKLVYINTGAVFMKNQPGKTTAIFGRPRLIVSGWGAFGDNGKLGTWEDALWTMKEGDAIFVRPSGGQNTEAYTLFNNGTEIIRYSFEDFRMYVLKPFVQTASEEKIKSELRSAEIRHDTKMVEFFRGALSGDMDIDTVMNNVITAMKSPIIEVEAKIV